MKITLPYGVALQKNYPRIVSTYVSVNFLSRALSGFAILTFGFTNV